MALHTRSWRDRVVVVLATLGVVCAGGVWHGRLRPARDWPGLALSGPRDPELALTCLSLERLGLELGATVRVRAAFRPQGCPDMMIEAVSLEGMGPERAYATAVGHYAAEPARAVLSGRPLEFEFEAQPRIGLAALRATRDWVVTLRLARPRLGEVTFCAGTTRPSRLSHPCLPIETIAVSAPSAAVRDGARAVNALAAR